MNNCDWCNPEPCRLQAIKDELIRIFDGPQTSDRKRAVGETLMELCVAPPLPNDAIEEKRIIESVQGLHDSRNSVARVKYRGRWYMIAKLADGDFYAT